MEFVLDMMEQCQYNEKSLNVPKGNDLFTHVILQYIFSFSGKEIIFGNANFFEILST